MQQKEFGKLDFKKFHPSGSLGAKLKTAEDLMITGKKIPFVNENLTMNKALKILTSKKLGILVIKNNKGLTTGIITDGQIRRAAEKNKNLNDIPVKKIMTKNPIKVEKNTLAAKALALMNTKKITSLCVYSKAYKDQTIGVLHIHNILEANVQ